MARPRYIQKHKHSGFTVINSYTAPFLMRHLFGTGYRQEQRLVYDDKTEPTRVIRYYPNQKKEEEFYTDDQGRRQGGSNSWHPNGTLHKRENYRDDALHGSFTEWHANNFYKEVGTYHQGKKIGDWYTHRSDGTLQSRTHYKQNGSEEGYTSLYDDKGKEIIDVLACKGPLSVSVRTENATKEEAALIRGTKKYIAVCAHSDRKKIEREFTRTLVDLTAHRDAETKRLTEALAATDNEFTENTSALVAHSKNSLDVSTALHDNILSFFGKGPARTPKNRNEDPAPPVS